MDDTTKDLRALSASDLFGLAREVLANLAMYSLKLDDAPASASEHFDKALFLLSEKCREWQPSDADVVAVIRGAREHMAYYFADADKPWPNACHHRVRTS